MLLFRLGMLIRIVWLILHEILFAVLSKFVSLGLAWDFTYSIMSWSIIMYAKFLKYRYLKYPYYHSSSSWPNINEYYNIILDNTFCTTRRGDQINF